MKDKFEKLLSCLTAKRVSMSLIGSAILAFGLYNIHALSDITEGGALGLSLLLDYHFSISPALSSFILNALFYLFGWRTFGHEFIGYSVFAGGGFSLCYAIFERFPPLLPEIAKLPLTAAILGAVFVGVGVGLAVRAGGAPSGDDALAMSLAKRFKTSLRLTYFISDAVVLLLSLSYIPWSKLVYSLITVVLSGQIVDLVQRIGNEK